MTDRTDTNDTTVLIVGGGVAGGTAARTLREEGFDGDVVLVTTEPHTPYERPPLSKGLLTGEAEVADATMAPRTWWDAHDVTLHTGRTVVDLGSRSRPAVLDDGTEVAWDHAVLATGASAVPSPVPGSDLDGAHTLRDLDDAVRLKAGLDAAEKVVVVGASWIGLEVAAAARAADCEVTVLGREDEPLEGVLGPDVGRAYRALHEGHGVAFRMGVDVERVRGEGRADGVVLADGTEVDADLVVLGTGVTVNTGLAARATLALDEDNGGVLVDAGLRTSDDRILAVGDLASHDHPRLGRLRVEHVEVARGHGRTAAKVLLGQDVVHDELPLFYSDQYDLGMEYIGHADPSSSRVVVRGELPDPPFVAFYLDADDVLRAGTHANAWDASDVFRELIGDRVDPEVLADTDVALEDLADAARVD